MHGRSLLCLLALAGFCILRGPLYGQADRVPTRDFPVSDPAPLTTTLPPRALPPQALLPSSNCCGPIDLVDITRAAGMIFSGTVTGIAHLPANRTEAIETMAITFHVEQAIRGTKTGQDLTIRQWMGVWTAGQRYQVGEQTLVFLYPPSKLGLTSSVSGTIGRFRIDPAGRVWLSAQQLSAFRQDPVLGGRSRVSFGDFARAVQRANEEE
jgi:hypothetical protein